MYQDGGRWRWIRICWYRCLQKFKVYERTKFCRHISIDGWDITTSVCEKLTSTILEIYFRLRFRPFARNLPIILHQATQFRPNLSWGVLGEYFPDMTSPIVLTPRRPSLGGNTSFEPFSVRISATVRHGRRIEKKQYNKKFTKVLYFPYLAGSPCWADSTLKLHVGWCPRHYHVCRVSNWNLHGLRFYRGSNFRFSHWF